MAHARDGKFTKASRGIFITLGTPNRHTELIGGVTALFASTTSLPKNMRLPGHASSRSTAAIEWYAYRGDNYRIGYAESDDGIKWIRQDNNSGIDVSEAGWDSEMIEYPCVFEHKGKHYLLYNGNGYGETGIGLAVLDVT